MDRIERRRLREGFELRMGMKVWVFVFFSLFIFNEYPFDGMFEFVFKIQVMEAADNYLILESVRHTLKEKIRRFDNLVSL